MKDNGLFQLTSKNLTQLSGPMGTERTWTNWIKFYSSLDDAKWAAEDDYTGPKGRRMGARKIKIQWTKKEIHAVGRYRMYWESQDLGFVMYHITPVKVED